MLAQYAERWPTGPSICRSNGSKGANTPITSSTAASRRMPRPGLRAIQARAAPNGSAASVHDHGGIMPGTKFSPRLCKKRSISVTGDCRTGAW
jgi:hypothetical protein